jgi:hypothetical protein
MDSLFNCGNGFRYSRPNCKGSLKQDHRFGLMVNPRILKGTTKSTLMIGDRLALVLMVRAIRKSSRLISFLLTKAFTTASLGDTEIIIGWYTKSPAMLSLSVPTYTNKPKKYFQGTRLIMHSKYSVIPTLKYLIPVTLEGEKEKRLPAQSLIASGG